MKQQNLLFLLICLCMLSCTTSKQKSTKKSIELSDVASITIGNSKNDSTALTMTDTDVKMFVRKWNKAKSKGFWKYLPTHWIIVNLKNGDRRVFRQNGEKIKENNDECFEIEDPEEYSGLYR